MALHEHPVNEARLLPVNSVWLWGPGELPREVSSDWRSLTANEPAGDFLSAAIGPELDLVAPGVSILQQYYNSSYSNLSGTSFPFVS